MKPKENFLSNTTIAMNYTLFESIQFEPLEASRFNP